MRPSESLRLAGRPIAYFPQLAKPLGGVNAAVLFSHFFYWCDKTDNPLGVYRTAEEIETETGLSVQEQRTARAKLRERGILLETQKRIEHRIYYRLDLDAFDELMILLAESAEKSSNIPEMQNQHSGDAESTFAEGGINIPEMQNQQPYKEQKITTVIYNNSNSAHAFSDFAVQDISADGWDGNDPMPSEKPAGLPDSLPDVSVSLAEQPMTADWQPHNETALAANLHQAALPPPGSDFYAERLVEFRSYWLTRPDAAFTAAAWQHKFLQAMLSAKARGLGKLQTGSTLNALPDGALVDGSGKGSTLVADGVTPQAGRFNRGGEPSKGYQALAVVEAEKQARLNGKSGLLPAPLFAELASGLQTLLALGLQGRPAADSVAATLAMWEKSLCQGRAWDEVADKGRLKTAFDTLAASATQFPAPAELTPRLPPRSEPLKLERKLTADEWVAQKAKAGSHLAELSGTLSRKRSSGKAV